MAQSVIIGINGDLLPFDETVDKLRTPGVGASSVTWVPDADTQCEALTVTENGSKTASNEGVYGWDYVAVSVLGNSATGTINGVEYTVTVDSNGYLVYTRV